jgi:hypothetical protein
MTLSRLGNGLILQALLERGGSNIRQPASYLAPPRWVRCSSHRLAERTEGRARDTAAALIGPPGRR